MTINLDRFGGAPTAWEEMLDKPELCVECKQDVVDSYGMCSACYSDRIQQEMEEMGEY